MKSTSQQVNGSTRWVRSAKRLVDLLTCCLVVLFASCSKRVSLDWSEVGTFSTPHNLELSSSTVKFRSGQGGTQTLDIYGNITWEITGLPDWLTADMLRGTGEAAVTLTCAANPSSTDERSAQFAVCAAEDDWDYRIPVAVYQVRALGLIYPDTLEVTFRCSEGVQTIPVASNVEDWTVSVAPMKKGEPTDWLSAVKTDDGKGVEISVVQNQELRREAYVVLKTNDSEKKITVVQKSVLDVSPMNIDFPSRGDRIKISVDTESQFDVINQADWLTVESVSENGFTLKAPPNLSVARRAVVKVVMTGQPNVFLQRELTVFQADPYNGHAFVDLGLPSGLLWATCNVGASSPEDYGDYFAWGETKKKDIYSWDMYDYFISGDTIGNSDSYIKFSKYNFSDSRILEMEDDAAQANWGGIWRMPTREEVEEICYNCTWQWTKRGDHHGYTVTSKSNGKSIFLPAAGYRYIKSLFDADIDGYYWTNTQITSVKYIAHILFFENEPSHCWYSTMANRNIGLSVRPVCPGDSALRLHPLRLNR